MSLVQEKLKAIELRKKGFSYSEILKQVPVAKSTLALWLRDVHLSKRQVQKLTEKKLQAAFRGGAARRNRRILSTKNIFAETALDFTSISKRELWLIGIMLYWAEGAKEKEWCLGGGIKFTNSDPHMIKVFLRWLLEVAEIQPAEIYFSIVIHENSANRKNEVLDYWMRITEFSISAFPHFYLKKDTGKTNRRNIGRDYYGLLQLQVRRSSKLCRKIAGWTNAVVNCLRK